MAIGYIAGDQSQEFNSVYKITKDMSGWSQTTIQVVAPVGGVIFVYGSNDGNALQGVREGSAQLATNFSPIECTNLATHAVSNTISAAGLYTVPVNAQYLRLQGSPAAAGTNVYRLIMFNSKVD